MEYYKILRDDLTHNGLRYHLGLNVDPLPFDEEPECGGGIFFSDKDNIMYFLNYGSKICKLHIPDNNKIIKVENKYKAHSIIIDEIYDIITKEGIEWLKKEGIKINWHYISIHQSLSEEFIKEFKDEVNWYDISWHQKLSENFIEEFKDKLNCYYISRYQTLSEDFIREFQDKVNWDFISRYQTLSENFIEEFKDKVNWYYISRYQTLSENFIEEFKDKIY